MDTAQIRCTWAGMRQSKCDLTFILDVYQYSRARSIVFAYMRLQITNTHVQLLRETRLRSLQVPSMTMTTSRKLNTTTQKVLKPWRTDER
jgi:hypothetical protein